MKTILVIAAGSALALATPVFAQTAGSAGASGSGGTTSPGATSGALSNPGMNPNTPPATGKYEGRAAAPDANGLNNGAPGTSGTIGGPAVPLDGGAKGSSGGTASGK